MTNSNPKSPYMNGAAWISMAILIPSGISLIGILNADSDTFTAAPRWIVFSGALMFFNAGIAIGLMDSGFNPYRRSKWLVYLHGMALLSIPLILAMLFNWVAFIPGKREFTASISIPLLSFSFDKASEIIGRIVFSIPALLMDAAIIAVIYGLIKDTFFPEDDSQRELKN